MRRTLVLLPATLLLLMAFPAIPSGASGHAQNMQELFNSPSTNTNSDLAFWGDRAYAGNYDGFRIFDISVPPEPVLLSDFRCFGPQNDVSVWNNEILVTSVDAVLTGPECGAGVASDPEDPRGWEGLRIFDVSDPTNPSMITDVYQDCGSHTHTMVPNPARNQLLIYNSSYPLRPGPDCGANTGDDPLHSKIQVVVIPLNDPAAARTVAEPPINYPGDPDNMFVPAEHGLPQFDPLRACHDITVLLDEPPGLDAPFGVAAGACAEQVQLWRLRRNLVPDTRRPIWVFDDEVDETGITGDPNDRGVAADFWHTTRFTWDGRYVLAEDESFGDGCPPVTEAFDADTGRDHMLDVVTGERITHFMIDRPEPDAYCSVHQGNFIPVGDRYLAVTAWYEGGVNVVDWTDPANPEEIAFFDLPPPGAAGSDNWSHYWYEGPQPRRGVFTYGQDGFGGGGRGFQVFRANVPRPDVTLGHLNPQTQEEILFP